jgi:hypothetical protein
MLKKKEVNMIKEDFVKYKQEKLQKKDIPDNRKDIIKEFLQTDISIITDDMLVATVILVQKKDILSEFVDFFKKMNFIDVDGNMTGLKEAETFLRTDENIERLKKIVE